MVSYFFIFYIFFHDLSIFSRLISTNEWKLGSSTILFWLSKIKFNLDIVIEGYHLLNYNHIINGALERLAVPSLAESRSRSARNEWRRLVFGQYVFIGLLYRIRTINQSGERLSPEWTTDQSESLRLTALNRLCVRSSSVMREST
jgi:hypothetical protein